jgi:hypothetical protein
MWKNSLNVGLLGHDVNQLHLVPSLKTNGFKTPVPGYISGTPFNCGAY